MEDEKLLVHSSSSTTKLPSSQSADASFTPPSSSQPQESSIPLFRDKSPKSSRQVGRSLFDFLTAEFRRNSYGLKNDENTYQRKRQRVYAFIKIPRELEKFLLYGSIQCLDVFLFIFTLLPIRAVVASYTLISKPFNKTMNGKQWLDEPQICDLLKALILLASCLLMLCVDTSVIYHLIRGQAVIKLYIFFNMLEIADKLFTSFGQDILDTLFLTATERRSRKREHLGTLPHLVLAIFYVFLHSLLILLQATTLNVAFNSQNKALLTIMMSNNFVELKGSVFKKFEKNNLFQMSCNDVRERFHYLVLLSIVMIRNMAEFSWDMDHFWQLIPDIVLVLLAEVLVDWVKHAFITKFNEISFEVYKDYRTSLAYDMQPTKENTAFSDHSDQVSRRMGFIPLPLSVLLSRIVMQSVKYSGGFCIILWILFYMCLVSLKLLINILLLGKTCDIIHEHKQQQQRQATMLTPSKKIYSKDILVGDQLLASFIELNQSKDDEMSMPLVLTRDTRGKALVSSASVKNLEDLYLHALKAEKAQYNMLKSKRDDGIEERTMRLRKLTECEDPLQAGDYTNISKDNDDNLKELVGKEKHLHEE